MDEKNPLPKYKTDLIPPSNKLPPPFDFERYVQRLSVAADMLEIYAYCLLSFRLTRFMAWGFIMAPIQYKWFQFLSKAFPITKDNGTTQALKRVVADQVFFAPVGSYLPQIYSVKDQLP